LLSVKTGHNIAHPLASLAERRIRIAKKTQPAVKAAVTSQKAGLKAPVKASKVNMPRLPGNHNETLLTV